MDTNAQQTQEPELSDNDLMALALKADTGEIRADEPVEAKTEDATPAAKSDKTTDSLEAGKDADTKGKTEFSDTDKKQGSEAEKAEQSEFKRRKELERRERSWQKLEEEKAAFKAEQERVAQERAELESSKAKASEYRDKAGYTAEEYEEFAKTTDDPDLAEKAQAKAAALRDEENGVRAKSAQTEFVKGWQGNLEKILEEEPTLRDQESDNGKALTKALKENPVFSMSPDGIRTAWEFAKLQKAASSASDLKGQVEKLTAEIERLNKLTGLNGNGPTQRPTIKSFEDMSGAEQEAELERLANEADRAA